MVKKVNVVNIVLVSINCPGVGSDPVDTGAGDDEGTSVYPSEPSLVSRFEFNGSVSVAIRELVISKVV